MNRILALLALLALAACNPPAPAPNININELANEYLFLELSMGLHDKAHVDAYFGPKAFRDAAESEAMSPQDIGLAAGDLARRLNDIDPGDDEMLAMRIAGLGARLQALRMRIAINAGNPSDFD
ncbi:MAG TPA: hypothetical protein VJ993_01210, partial [Woeseiaceae bacterium]|nr:hypothetical protein [Woeseiaceae bacterium]